MTNEQVEALPMEGRNVASLVVTVGAAVDTGNPSSRSLTQTRGIAIAGGQQFGVAYLLDGALHNNVYDGDNLVLPFPDAVQEFKIETSSQNAQNGYKAGGTASFATKSGTNVFHGDAFEFARHHRFNATSPFASINKATGKRFDDGLVRNQFGGVLGGPIVRDRVFFFAGYQGTRTEQTPADIVTFIPTPAMLAGDFSTVASAQCRAQGNLTLPAALGFTNNQINPALLSPAAVKIAKMLPTTTDPCGQVAYSQTTKPRETQPIGRVDWQVNTAHQLFARYQLATTFWDPAFTNSGGNILSAAGTGAGGRDNASHSLAIGETWVIEQHDDQQRARRGESYAHPSDARRHVRSRRRGREDVQPRAALHEHHDHGRLLDQYGDGNLLVLQAEHVRALRRLHDGPRGPSVRAGRRVLAVQLENGIERALDGSDFVQRLRDGPSARRLPARPHVRVPRIDAVPAGHHPALHGALRAGHVAVVVAYHAQLRRPVGAVVPAEQQGPRVLQLRHGARKVEHAQHGSTRRRPPVSTIPAIRVSLARPA